MQTLWRYVGLRFLSAFLGSLLILTLVVLVVDMLMNIDEVMAVSSTFSGAVVHLLIRTAALYLPYLIPVATFTGAFVAVGQAARSREVIAIKAGGIAPLRALLPVFVLTAGVAVVALLSNEFVTVRAAQALNLLRGEADVSLRAGQVWYHTGRFIYNIGEQEETGAGAGGEDSARQVSVYERDERGRLIRVIHADEATRLEPQIWRFRGATIRRFDPDRPQAPPERERLAEVTLELAEDRSPRLHDATLASLPVWDLLEYVSSVRAAGGNPGRAGELVHERLSVPFLVLLFALLAVPLGLRVEQTKSLSLPALEGVIVLFIFLSLRETGGAIFPGAAPAALAPWGVLGLFYVYGAWQLARVPQ